jgi:hypothetical protein
VIDNNALPHPAYARLCRDGARAVSENFLRLYLRTTYLADRKTTLAEWERLRPNLTMSFRIPQMTQIGTDGKKDGRTAQELGRRCLAAFDSCRGPCAKGL